MEFILPTAPSPGEDPSELWSVQLQLLRFAEDTLGQRDASKTICQPVFADDGPYIRDTPNLDGAFAVLSRNAEANWPTVVRELSPETVHLLNPKPRVGKWLSEGIAEAFSDYAQRCYGMEPQSINKVSYRRSLKLVSELPPDPLTAGRRIRDACGPLNNATRCILESLFPNVDSGTLTQLCKTFERYWSDEDS